MSEKCDNDLMVSIRCITYNHEPYIRQCLEGFVMQKTNFRFEAIVHDDASTDGTATIIKEYAEKYPDIIKPIFETENQYSKHDGSIRRIMNEHTHGKYVAMCEGDDYWTDPLKLQKQVDFLERHNDYGLVYTNVDFYYQEQDTYIKNYFTSCKIKQPENFEEHLINPGYIAPCTWLYRKKYAFLDRQIYVDGTYPLALDVFADSNIYFLDNSTTVYRVLNESASHSKFLHKRYNFGIGVFKIQKDYIEKYKTKVSDELKLTIYARTYYRILPSAIVLSKNDFIKEAEYFFNTNFVLRPWLILRFRKLLFLKYIFALIYKRRGFKI